MRLQWNWTSAVTIRDFANEADIILQPGNVCDVPANQYQALKDQFGAGFADVGNDAQEQMVVKTITSAEMLALNTTPKALVPAPGTGYAIEVTKVIAAVKYNSAAYATNLSFDIKYDSSTAGDAAGVTTLVAPVTALLDATADKVQKVNGTGAAVANVVINKGISAVVNTGNPATGNSPVKVRVFYRIVSVS